MKYLALSIISVLIMSVSIFAQPPDILWTHTYGGNEDDNGSSVLETTDGELVVAGTTDPDGFGVADFILFSTDESGTELWSETYGGDGEEWCHDAVATEDGGYLLVGWTSSFGIFLSDGYLVKTDASGNEQWTQTFGGEYSDWGTSIEQTSDGGYIIVGTTNSYSTGGNDYDSYLIKIDVTGEEQWSQTIGGVEDDYGYDVKQTPDGGYIACGLTLSGTSGFFDTWLTKTDASGNVEWSEILWDEPVDDYGYCVELVDDGYVVAGEVKLAGADNYDACLTKTDLSGAERWQITVDWDNNDDYFKRVVKTSDDGLVMTGGAQFSEPVVDFGVAVYKVDSEGTPEWEVTWNGDGDEEGADIQQTIDDGFIITGSALTDILLIRLEPETGVIDLNQPQPLTYSLLPAFPNPFNPSTLIRFQMPVAGDVQIQVYDIQGNVVATLIDGWQTAGSYEASFDGKDLSSGIYLARFSAGDLVQMQKLVFMK